MTLRLILTRHAKSAWDDPLLDDHSRILNARGQRSSPLIGTWLTRKDYLPGEALVSDAVRTRETWALIAATLPMAVPAQFLPALYLAGPDRMCAALQDANADCVMMIGHNPGIAEFARLLVAKPPADPQFSRYPTCATLVVDFACEKWRNLRFGTGVVRDFTMPRALE